MKTQNFMMKHAHIFICSAFVLMFSSWLMFHTFSYDAKTHDMRIAFKLWSDFGAHIPLIRSFSMGDNLSRFLDRSTQYPIFPGEPIRYHFLFYMIVGVLERIGLRIDWALNIPSIIGFSVMMLSLYYLAWKLTRSKTAASLTLVFFLFNGSFGFLRFFELHPLSANSISDIVHAKDFPAFAPWGPGEVTAFWNLNIYTNQRHLAAGFSIILLFILTTLYMSHLNKRKQIYWAIMWGFILGILPFFHQPALVIIAVFMCIYFFVFPNTRIFLLCTGLISLELIIPQLLSVSSGASSLEWYPGYTIHNELAVQNDLIVKFLHMLSYWWQNIGLHMIFIPFGYLLLPKRSKLILLPLIPLFIIPNLFKFSVEASANHKFFNFVLLLGSIATANAIVQIVSYTFKRHSLLIKTALSISLVFVMGSLVLSGIIDFFVVANDVKGTLSDISSNETAMWIQQHTPPSAIFLNSSYLYSPASLAGRAIFLGWPYFAWSAGYKETPSPIMKQFYESKNVTEQCTLLQKNNLSYVLVETVENDTNLPKINLQSFLKRFNPDYISSNKQLAIFSVNSICSAR